jgi:DNA polymerase III delta prime subunit
MFHQSIIFTANKTERFVEKENIIELVRTHLPNLDLEINLNQIFLFFSKKSKIGIEEIKEIIELNSVKSNETLRIIAIIDAEKLTAEAQNSLLKVLEEPNSNTLLLLITLNELLLLDTIISRCRVLQTAQEVKQQADFKNKYSEDFLNERNFVKRSKIIQEISSLDNNREESLDFTWSLFLHFLEVARTNLTSKNINILRLSKKVHVALKLGTNTKLCLDRLNIEFENYLKS